MIDPCVCRPDNVGSARVMFMAAEPIYAQLSFMGMIALGLYPAAPLGRASGKICRR